MTAIPPRRRFGQDLPARAAAGVIMMALALGLAWVGGFPFLVLWFVASVLVVWEWQRLIGGSREWGRVAIGALTMLAASPFALHGSGLKALLALAAGAIATGAVADPNRRFSSAAGILYAGAIVVGVNVLRASPAYGLAAVLWLYAVVWGTDVMAYFGGRLLQGPKLWPSVSPGKTWSGALVGAVAAAVFGTIVALVASPEPVRLGPMLAVGLVVSAFSQLGDLFESAMKRRAGVKDSSHLIPGHGGVMDRLDGFIFAVALTAFLAAVRSTGPNIAQGLFQW